MGRIRVRRPSPGLVIAVVALVLALGGGAYAAATITGADIRNGSITGKDVKNGSLTGKDVKKNSLTGKQVKESSLGQVPSAADADTLAGQPPSAFESDWVLVQGTAGGATVLAQSGGISVARLGLGVYSVDLGESAVRRPLSATINLGGGAGFVSAAPCGGTANNPGGVNCGGVNDNNHVLVATQATNGAAADRTFYLAVGPGS
ncbi:MAG TPA: hypothetical protein VFS37_06510 [Conexibacter sp.]|nr:hypothetical protein [Conexibacter sp.]